MARVGVYLDISNLYYTVKINNDGAKVNFKKYLEFIKDFGDIVIKKAFIGVLNENETNKFHPILTGLGFELVKQKLKVYRNNNGLDKKCDLDVKIAVTLIEDIDKYDRVIVGSADGDFLPVYKFLKDRGKDIIVIASKVSNEVTKSYTFVEIPPSLLIKRK